MNYWPIQNMIFIHHEDPEGDWYNNALYTYYNDNIVLNSIKGTFASDIIGDSLSVDTFSFTVRYNASAPGVYIESNSGEALADSDHRIFLLKPPYATNEYLADVQFGDSVYWSVGGYMFVKGYISKVERVGKYAWKVTCVSGVGLLTEKMHPGGVYTGATFSTVIASIIGDTFDYHVAENVAAVNIYGWLPYDTARNNLHRLLFAVGAALSRHDPQDGYYHDYDVIFPGQRTITMDDDRIALGGSVQLSLPVDGVEVTEHSFAALLSDPTETLYDNTGGDVAEADHLTVVFSEPMHHLSATGTMVINDSDYNYAVVTGTGVLSGQKYTHTETVVSLGNPAGNTVKRVTSNGLVTIANSINVARRVLNYYQSAKKIKAKMFLSVGYDIERTGDMIIMNDAWGEAVKAYLAKMDVSSTSALVANCELIGGYTPTSGGNNYTRRKFITRSTANTWTVPNNVTNIRVVIIQGGQGGQGGTAGHNGWGGQFRPNMGSDQPVDGQLQYAEDESRPNDHPPHWAYPQDHAVGMVKGFVYGENRQYAVDGGSAGNPGESGRILSITKTVTPGEVLTFGIGAGGVGGSARAHGSTSGGTGTAGGDTTVSSSAGWSATTENGVANDAGFFETFSNATFALPGEAGHDGAKGGTSDAISTNYANSGSRGNSGESCGSNAGGAGGAGVSVDAGYGFIAGHDNTASGGGGGGAAWGRKGSDGGAATYSKTYTWIDDTHQLWRYSITSGCGGAGANAVAPAKANYGCGGAGGNGGGGGGNSGGVFSLWYGYDEDCWGASPHVGQRANAGNDYFAGGLGGSGSAGGAGGDGIAIIYY